jgi:hypothetical protein
MSTSKTLLNRLQTALLRVLENEQINTDERLRASQLLIDLREQYPPVKRNRKPKTENAGSLLGSK